MLSEPKLCHITSALRGNQIRDYPQRINHNVTADERLGWLNPLDFRERVAADLRSLIRMWKKTFSLQIPPERGMQMCWGQVEIAGIAGFTLQTIFS